ncbi:ribosomal protein L18a, component of cytosolic 80S ribosome and 60S large subunit [Reticulomyxa filosa]|uniref:Ribosomal protein L18a, component of cytosolic 80S ribosome and 60S large subunit n=1 Tax=Reticulomyxa filosa TaxID=46433 RepID=X6PDK2_RETFI|nr:ribosomal protein L18a, component of cytosolic 80S ribosome and 60S large subunit [Reticulomyxa filosa]|eukprot:ETO36575.1 ribosomal protein L18a, component of cytosolic 80S ribosome and 60S large subunit [Reticulomyxa filosa]
MFLRYFVVVGRAKPTETNKNPKIYKLKVFCRNDVKAKSLFWKHMANFDRVKKTQGQILAVHRILDRDPTRVKNFGFWLKYRSRMGIHNMYREYRDVTVDSAAQKLYDDMAGRHKAKPDNIHIIDCREISDHQVKRPRVRQFLVCKKQYIYFFYVVIIHPIFEKQEPELRFKNPFKVPRAPTRRHFRVFSKRKLTSQKYFVESLFRGSFVFFCSVNYFFEIPL